MRIDYRRTFPQAAQALRQLDQVVGESSLEPGLVELVKIRASQLNGCAYCLDLHTREACAAGESEQRIYVLSAWREASFYSPRERAALEWCETLTLVGRSGAPDDVFRRVAEQFSEEEVVALTLAIVAINGWNRFAVGLQREVGR